MPARKSKHDEDEAPMEEAEVEEEPVVDEEPAAEPEPVEEPIPVPPEEDKHSEAREAGVPLAEDKPTFVPFSTDTVSTV